MNVEGRFYANPHLESLVLDELKHFCEAQGVGGFLPAVSQIANVASLPGIVGASMAMPDVHSGYGFSIGNVRVRHRPSPRVRVLLLFAVLFVAVGRLGARRRPCVSCCCCDVVYLLSK